MSTGRRRLYIIIALLCGGAWLVDRLFLSAAGSPATALGANGSALPLSAAALDAAALGNMGIPDLPFPHDVARFAADLPLTDFFAPPRIRQPGGNNENLTDNEGSDEKHPINSKRLGSASFMRKHKVLGILLHGQMRVAIVDGTWRQVGESLDGCAVREIMGDRVVFECHDGDAVLEFAAVYQGADR